MSCTMYLHSFFVLFLNCVKIILAQDHVNNDDDDNIVTLLTYFYYAVLLLLLLFNNDHIIFNYFYHNKLSRNHMQAER